MSLSIVVPCFNESRNIPKLLGDFDRVRGDRPIEVVLVNNGSLDNSSHVISKHAPKYDFVKVVTVPVNKGYGYGILEGLRASTGMFVGWTHADLQTDPRDVIRAYDVVKAHDFDPDLYVKGNRKGRPFFDQVFTIGMGIMESVLFGKWLWEINAQPNIFHRDFFATWKNPPHDYSLDLYTVIMAMQQKLSIKRINVFFPERKYGESSWNTSLAGKWRFIRLVLEASFQFRRSIS